MPSYNQVLQQADIWGRATVHVQVRPAGVVDSVAVWHASHVALVAPIAAAVQTWLFEPFSADSSEASLQRGLTVEFVYRVYGCRTHESKVVVRARPASLLIEEDLCSTVRVIRDPAPVVREQP